MSELFGPIFGTSSVDAVTSDGALLSAMCDIEAALADGCARAGLIADAEPVVAACNRARLLNITDLGLAAGSGGNPVIPLVAAIRTDAGDAGRDVHLGATSQDVLDTALMLVAQRAVRLVSEDLAAIDHRLTELARTHRATPMLARTLLQPAVATTFGALAATWGSGVARALAKLDELSFPVQLGGAAGTLAPLHPHGPAVRAVMAERLGLTDPGTVWHTDRTVIADLAGALGLSAIAIGKVATDIVLLSQAELGEVREARPGGSSAMAHKQNPIAAVTARAGAAQAPGLVATLLENATPELQRGAGSWHAEWPALLGLLRAVGGAAAQLRVSLTGLHVDPAAMARNLAQRRDAIDATDLGHATDVVDHFLDRR